MCCRIQNCSPGCCPHCHKILPYTEALRERQLARLQEAKEKTLYLERLRRLANEKSILADLSERNLWS